MKGAAGEPSDFFWTSGHGLTAKIASNHEPSIRTTTGTQKCASVNTARVMEAFKLFSLGDTSTNFQAAGSMVMSRRFANKIR
jgi:hypothetical protein